MNRVFDDLAAFALVASERSFTRAAAKLGVSPSALSQTIRSLEDRLGLRLLVRTTRSVAPTDAGKRFLEEVAPRLEEIQQALATLSEMREKPAATIRISAGEHAVHRVVQPALARLLSEYPDIKVELSIDHGFIDIVAKGFDAGIRLGEQVAKDMIAVRIGPSMRMAVVGSPAYFAKHPGPSIPEELTAHRCINIRLPTYGGLLPWEFERDGRKLKVRVDGPLIFNTGGPRLDSALQGLGIAYMLEDIAAPFIAAGALVRVLEEWCPSFDGYHLYYPSRRLSSPAFSLLVEALRYRP